MQAKKIKTAFLLGILLAATVVLAGCVQTDGDNVNDTNGTFAGRGFAYRNIGNRTTSDSRGAFGSDGFANLTDAQRKEIMAQRLKAAQNACFGKVENDACTLNGFSGNGTEANDMAEGSCRTGRNDGLECRPQYKRGSG